MLKRQVSSSGRHSSSMQKKPVAHTPVESQPQLPPPQLLSSVQPPSRQMKPAEHSESRVHSSGRTQAPSTHTRPVAQEAFDVQTEGSPHIPSVQTKPSAQSVSLPHVPGFGFGFGSPGATHIPASQTRPSSQSASAVHSLTQPTSVQTVSPSHSKSPRHGGRSGGSTARQPTPSQ